MDESKLSENIGKYDAGEYFVTATIWRTNIQGLLYDTFEIGIREKTTGKFTLLQNSKWNHQSVQEVANAIAHILSIPTECYTPEWFQEYFT
jgi:hypothetical protein